MRISFLIGLFVVGAVFFILYFMVAAFIAVFVLGLKGDAVTTIQYICLILGYATTAYLMRSGFTQPTTKKPAENNQNSG
jgi:hypothetical protein